MKVPTRARTSSSILGGQLRASRRRSRSSAVARTRDSIEPPQAHRGHPSLERGDCRTGVHPSRRGRPRGVANRAHGATPPHPRHQGKGLEIADPRSGIDPQAGLQSQQANRLHAQMVIPTPIRLKVEREHLQPWRARRTEAAARGGPSAYSRCVREPARSPWGRRQVPNEARASAKIAGGSIGSASTCGPTSCS